MSHSARPAARLVPALADAGAATPALVASAVALLPQLPPPDPADRYGVAKLTISWLLSQDSDHTRRGYYADLAAWLDWCRRTALDPLRARPVDLDDWTATLTATGPDEAVRPASPATVARRLAAVSSWYAYLHTNDLIERNPARAAARPKPGKTPRRRAPTLSEAETALLLDHAEARARRLGSEPAWRDAAVVALLFYTGVRVSAITRADLTDLDTEAGYEVLRFTKKGGQRDLVRLAAQAKLPAAERITPHSGRGTIITTLLGHDVALQKVQDLAGHADPRTTRRYDETNNKLARSPVPTFAAIIAAQRRAPPGPLHR